jgi:hypothetical protein
VDILLARPSFRAADRILRNSGLHRLRASGHGPHRFYVTFADGRWLKLDVKLTERYLPRWPSLRRRSRRGRRGARLMGRRVGSAFRFIRRHRPAALRRPGVIVAVLGMDATRSDFLRRLKEQIPFAVRFVDSRGGPGRGRPAGLKRRLYIYAAAWQGDVVLCGHPGVDLVTRRGRGDAATSGRLLARCLHARPDLTVDLRAPARAMVRVSETDEVDVSAGIWQALRSRER